MKNIMIYLLCLIGCESCIETVDYQPIRPETATVTFSIACPEMETVTRALDPSQEKTVRDLNLYLFHKTTDVNKHIYTDRNTEAILTNLVKGDYEVYVVANMGRDLGALTQAEVMQYSRSITQVSDLSENNVLPMSVQTQLTVNQNMNFPILLQRAVAKVDVSLSVAPAVSGQISIQSVQVIGVPNTMSFFALNRPTDRAELLDYPKQSVLANALSYSFYMPENAQGINARITDQRQKNRANAPTGATYLHIQGASAGGKVDYFVYLGENNTSDFNTYRNKQYIVHAVIKGVNEVDTRVSTTEMTVTPFAPTYAPTETAHGQITVKCTNNAENLFYLSYALLSGSGSLQIDGVNRTPNTPFLFLSEGAEKTANIAYAQSNVGVVQIRFDMTDKYGYAISKQIATNFVIPYFPLEASASAFSQDTAYRPSAFNLAFAEKNYTGKIRIKYELVSGSGTLLLNGATVASGASVEYDQSDKLPGSFTSTSVGAVKLRFTLTDDHGQTKICETGATIKPQKVSIASLYTINGTINTIVDGSNSGMYRDPCYLKVILQTAQPVPSAVTLSLKVDYTTKYTYQDGNTTSTPSSDVISVTIPKGSKTNTAIVKTYSEECSIDYGYYRRIVKAGYRVSLSRIGNSYYGVKLTVLSVHTGEPDPTTNYVSEPPSDYMYITN